MQPIAAYPAIFTPSDSGGFEVSFPQFPGCVTFGDSFEAAQAAASEALALWIEELEAHKAIDTHSIQKQRPIFTDITVTIHEAPAS